MNQPRVVVGVDGSPPSEAAVVQAAHFASTRGMTLHVLHAFAPDLPMLGFGALADRSVVTEHGHRLLQNAIARAHAAHPDLTVTSGLHDGYASHALIASSHTAALVVVGVTGHGVFSLTSMGAVAMQVLTHAHCPVLVVGHASSATPAPGGRVVVGVDGSEESLAALRTAVREATVLGGSVEVVHAWQPRAATDPTLASASSWEDYVAGLERLVDRTVAADAARAPGHQGRGARAARRPAARAERAQRGRQPRRRREPGHRRLRGPARGVDRAAPRRAQRLPGARQPLTVPASSRAVAPSWSRTNAHSQATCSHAA